MLSALRGRLGGRRPDDVHVRRGRVLRRHAITLALDVGANTGQYGASLRRHSAYTGRIVSFEPVTAAHAELERRCAGDPSWTCRRLALGAEAGAAPIHVAETTLLSSFLEARALPEFDASASGAEDVPIERLDAVVPELVAGDDRILLKLDVQGFEREVLIGAEGILDRIDVLECEIALAPIYEEQPAFREMVELIDDLGFTPIGVEPNYSDPMTGTVLDADFLFVRDTR